METYKTFSEAYPYIIEDILRNGKSVAPRGLPIKELTGYAFKLETIEDSLPLQMSRKLNYRFGVLEGLLNVWGQYPKEIVLHYNKNLGRYVNPETGYWDGAYAPRLKGSIKAAYELIKKDPDTRQAVLPIFRTSDIVSETQSLDVPCTISLQLLYREGKLNMIANMRSNDILWGTAYDVNQFVTIQKAVAAWLECPTGWYIHQAGSMHAYNERDNQLEEIVTSRIHNIEKFADFKHPVWTDNYENTMSGLSALFAGVHNFVTESKEDFVPPTGIWSEYLQILTGSKKINFN